MSGSVASSVWVWSVRQSDHFGKCSYFVALPLYYPDSQNAHEWRSAFHLHDAIVLHNQESQAV